MAVHASWGFFKLDSASISITAAESLSFGATADAGAHCSTSSPGIGLFPHPITLGTFDIQVGPVPVTITPKLQLYLSGQATIEAKATFSLEQGASVTVGASYEHGSFHPISSLSQHFTPAFTAEGNASGEVALTPTVDTLIYDVAGPSFDVGAVAKLNANVKASPWWTLQGCLQAGLGFVISPLGLNWSDPHLIQLCKTLLSATSAPPSIGGSGTPPGGGGGGGTGPPPSTATCEDAGCAGNAPTPIGNVSALTAGDISTCVLILNGEIDCWGSNEAGQLGDGSLDPGSFESHPTPLKVAGIDSATQVSVSGGDACAVVSGGKIYCWGSALWGELGNESESPGRNPAPVEAKTTHEATQVSAGDNYTCAVLFSGHVECWGYNAQGELGDGSTSNSLSGVTVTGLSGVTDLASGEDADATGHTCAVSGGAVYCWGDNREGQLGDGTVKDSDTPVKVPGITNAVSVTTGDETTCALLATGGIECWGYNAGGMLGDGTTENSTTPVNVQGITDATGVSAGVGVTCASLATHVAECWGFGVAGALGNGTQTSSDVPVQVSGLTDVSSVTSGYSMGCALRLGGGVDCWGGDVYGQLGNGAGGSSARGFSAFPLAVAAP